MVKDFYTPGEVVADRLLTVEQVAKRLQMAKMTIYRYIKASKSLLTRLAKNIELKRVIWESF